MKKHNQDFLEVLILLSLGVIAIALVSMFGAL